MTALAVTASAPSQPRLRGIVRAGHLTGKLSLRLHLPRARCRPDIDRLPAFAYVQEHAEIANYQTT